MWVNIIKRESKDTTIDDGPPLYQKAVNFTKAVVKHVADGLKHVSEEDYRERLSICRRCDKLSKDGKEECLVCGCPVVTKAEWSSEECPIGRWLAHPEDHKRAAHVEEGPPEPRQETPKAGGGCNCGAR